jgi:hypothetical protein
MLKQMLMTGVGAMIVACASISIMNTNANADDKKPDPAAGPLQFTVKDIDGKDVDLSKS